LDGATAILNRKIPKYPFYLQKGQRAWHAHVQIAFEAYSRRLVNKRSKKVPWYIRKRHKKPKTRLNLRQSKNNFFTTLHTFTRKVLWCFSCGRIGLGGPRRSTPFGAQQLGRFTSKEVVKSKAYKAFLIMKSAYTTHMRGCISNLGTAPRFKALVDLIPRPHNGMRFRKIRRI